jgi:hypothetical protein
MRTKLLGVLVATFVTVGLVGCAGPYSAEPERLSMPKKKKVAKKPPGEGEGEPDTCRTNFKGDPVRIPSKAKRNEADGYAQDADNVLSGIDKATPEQKRKQVIDALNRARTALTVDPYSPRAHLVMAAAYAWVGKKKCALAMLERLAELKQIPEEQNDAIKMADKVATEKAFAPFKAEAEGVAGK